MKWIDSHCHLNYDYSPKAIEDLVREARLGGLVAMVTIGTEVATIGEVQKISEAYPEVYHTVGVHPHEASTLRPEDWTALETAARHPKCRGVGEIGLDYHYDHSPRDVQRARFEEQLAFARRVSQPVVIHCREAEEDTLTALRAHVAASDHRAPIPGIIHCFTGTEAFGCACLDLGFYISFSGVITFKNAEDLRACARAFPLDRLLVETDSPFLAPIPYRGKKCEPAMVALTGRKLAEVRGVVPRDIAEATTSNAMKVFRLAV